MKTQSQKLERFKQEYIEKARQYINSGEFELAIYPLTVDSDKASDFLKVFTTGENVFGYSSDEYNRIWNDLGKNPTNDKINYAHNSPLFNI